MQETFSIKIATDKVKELEQILHSVGLVQQPIKSPYEMLRLSSLNLNAILYSSGKFVLQGSDMSELKSLIGDLVENSVDSKNSIGEIFTARVGADEVGKGDYFGPMVVAAAYVKEDHFQILKKLGIADSKKLSDSKIEQIFLGLPSSLKYEVGIIAPSKYNKVYKGLKNISVLLAKAHAENIERLIEQVRLNGDQPSLVLIDQFSKKESRMLDELGELTKETEFRQFHKGESDIAVATASVIARATFLHEWEKMETEWSFQFPKGATDVISAAQKFVDQYGFESLDRVAKTSFKTTGSIKKRLV